ncbi:hypothetical protein Q8A67_020015 [Cirrhinus molitorella]|uniref:G-protein coupled receptors family 2 profile 2 domain-containing protein n=1 Tax=Cirrhinus molitorella TaxID=172907 RepID=A0AA88P871_9TELE|nr:hypothetical protein Q8A67_020015 [Cirrhinus molitorella]
MAKHLPNVQIKSPRQNSPTSITHIGCGISIFFLTIALFMHFLLRKAKSNQATKILMNMFVALCLLNASFLSNESVANTQDNGACVFIALVLHYSMLASFTWFFIQALHMYLWLIRQNITITNYMRKITVLGWVCPAPIVVVIVSVEGYEAVILNATSGKSTQMCWITNSYIHYIVNIGYYALVFILIVIVNTVHAKNIKAIVGQRKTFRKQLMMVLGLFLLFGLTWSVAFFSYGPMIVPSYYIFTVLNSFQGKVASKFIVHLKNSECTCVTCDESDFEGVEYSVASEYLENTESMMEEMENNNAIIEEIATEKAAGLLQIHAENTETEDTCYSSTQNKINVVNCSSILNANLWALKIPKEAVNKSRQENHGCAFVAVLRFKNMRNKIPQPDAYITEQDLESLTLITSIGCGISMFFLSIALFMHFLLRKAKSNQATKILMNMFVALCLLNASFLSNESVANTQDNGACVFIALVLHYSMLASFTWFFIQALHMYLWLIRQNITITNYMRKITVLGWVCPAPIVVVIVSLGGYEAVILNATTGKTTRMCWITNSYIHYIVNIGYYALVFIFTTGIFIMIVTRIVQARNIRATDGKRKTSRKQLMMVLSLFLLFGLTWSVAFFSYGPMRIPSYYIFTVLNSFQGFFLFLYYYHIHNDVAGNFSDDPESTDSTTTIAQSTINAAENIYNN